MAAVKRKSGSNGYWQGQTDTKLENMAADINDIKKAMEKMAESVDGLRLWKAKVAGISGSAAGIVVLAIKALEKLWI